MSENGLIRSLHNQIADILRAEIRKMSPGDKLSSEATLAKRFSVSIMTLRNAMLCLEMERLIDRRAGRGTFVKEVGASEPAKERHVAIATGIDLFSHGLSYYYSGTIQELQRIFAEHNFKTSVYVEPPLSKGAGATESPALTQALENGRVCGIASLAFHPGKYRREIMHRDKIPIVGEDDSFPFSVSSDSWDIGSRGARFLIEQGRRKLAFIWWAHLGRGETNPSIPGGFRAELEHNGIPLREEWFQCDAEKTGWKQFPDAWNAFDEKPDGLVIADDLLFPDVATTILDMQIKVPEQLMIVTHSNKGSRMLIPFPAALLQYDPVAQARAMADLLLPAMAGKKPSHPHIKLLHELIPPVGLGA